MRNALKLDNNLFSREQTVQINNAFDKLEKSIDIQDAPIQYKHHTSKVTVSSSVPLHVNGHMIDESLLDLTIQFALQSDISTEGSLVQIGTIDCQYAIDMYCSLVSSDIGGSCPVLIRSNMIYLGQYVTLKAGTYILHIEYVF